MLGFSKLMELFIVQEHKSIMQRGSLLPDAWTKETQREREPMC